MSTRPSVGGKPFTIEGTVFTALFVLAGVVLFAGICGVLFGVSADASDGTSLKCGNAITGLESSFAYDAVRAGLPERAVDARAAVCDSAITTRRVWAWPAIGVGLTGSFVLVYLVPFVHPTPAWFLTQPSGKWTNHR